MDARAGNRDEGLRLRQDVVRRKERKLKPDSFRARMPLEPCSSSPQIRSVRSNAPRLGPVQPDRLLDRRVAAVGAPEEPADGRAGDKRGRDRTARHGGQGRATCRAERVGRDRRLGIAGRR